MTTDDTAPVTRRDLKEFGEELRAELRAEMRDMNATTIQQMMVLFESLRHDVLGALRDATSVFRDGHGNHERRIKRLERHLHLAA